MQKIHAKPKFQPYPLPHTFSSEKEGTIEWYSGRTKHGCLSSKITLPDGRQFKLIQSPVNFNRFSQNGVIYPESETGGSVKLQVIIETSDPGTKHSILLVKVGKYEIHIVDNELDGLRAPAQIPKINVSSPIADENVCILRVLAAIGSRFDLWTSTKN